MWHHECKLELMQCSCQDEFERHCFAQLTAVSQVVTSCIFYEFQVVCQPHQRSENSPPVSQLGTLAKLDSE